MVVLSPHWIQRAAWSWTGVKTHPKYINFRFPYTTFPRPGPILTEPQDRIAKRVGQTRDVIRDHLGEMPVLAGWTLFFIVIVIGL